MNQRYNAQNLGSPEIRIEGNDVIYTRITERVDEDEVDDVLRELDAERKRQSSRSEPQAQINPASPTYQPQIPSSFQGISPSIDVLPPTAAIPAYSDNRGTVQEVSETNGRVTIVDLFATVRLNNCQPSSFKII